jgi:hypothetical protein
MATSTRVRRNVTRRDADVVRERIAAKFGYAADDKYGPKVIENWHWLSEPCKFAIVWEEGPYDWAQLASMGGISEEFGFDYGNGIEVPAGLFIEPVTSWAVDLCII